MDEMVLRFLSRPSRLLTIAFAIGALFTVLTAGPAYAEQIDQTAIAQMFEQLQAAPVIQDNCTFCHANIADTDNYASEIVFTHGNHLLLPCSSCHSRFPHQREGTSRPTMEGCFNCHGLAHGPAGELATGECDACHKTRREELRPAFHVYNWAEKPHVDPANKEFNTTCARCHEPASCNDCHDAKGVRWRPEDGWAYDSEDGCLACHESALLQKLAATGNKSYQVTGVEDSAHRGLTCQECHTDFRYDGRPSFSKLWTINASQGCVECHENPNTGDPERDKELSAAVAAYEKSVHAAALKREDANLDSATCGSCHGGHFIYRFDSDANQQRMHNSAYRVCARCKDDHGDEYDSYDDYYHGKAYKKGAADAPTCWDCHDAHTVLSSDDPKSTVYPKNVGNTCGQQGCHKGTDEKFGTESAALIHQKAEAAANNPITVFIGNITGR